MIDHVMGQPWTREQVEAVAAGRTQPGEIYKAMLDRIACRYRRFEDPARMKRVMWLIGIEVAVAMRDTARPEARAEWEGHVQRMMALEPPAVPGVREPDFSAWMPPRAA